MSSASEVGRVEGGDPLPAVVRGGRPVRRAVDGEEPVARVVVAVDLVRLAVLLQQPLQLVDMLGRGRLVLVAEQAEQRTAQVAELVLEVGYLERKALGRRACDEGAVAVDGGV